MAIMAEYNMALLLQIFTNALFLQLYQQRFYERPRPMPSIRVLHRYPGYRF